MLSSYRILDFTDGGSALCGQVLADLGADVILLEPPGGSPTRQQGPFYRDERELNASLPFWSTNRNKRSVRLDIASQEGREAFLRLAASADALIESHPPGYLAERGLGYEQLSELFPGLVVVSITPFGQTGPKAHWPATDLTVTAASGVLILTGDEDRPPLASSLPQAFLNAGAEAAVGTLLALAARERDGVGQHVDVSAQTAMMMTTQSFVLCHGWNDEELRRLGGGIRLGDLRLRFVYPCKDGYANVTLLFGPALGPATARLFRWMHEEGVVDDATRDKDWIGYAGLLLSGQEPIEELERCIQAVEAFTRRHTKAELFEGAMTRRVLIVPLSDMTDLSSSPQLAARDYWTPVEHPELGAEIRYPGAFAKFSAAPIEYRRRPPLLGEHSAEVLQDLTPRTSPAARTSPVTYARKPLDGLKVLDFTWVYAGPAATRYLADYGATVVRVETGGRIDALRVGQPFKDGEPGLERSGNYANVNVGKLGMCLNLRVESALETALRLVEWADVLVENFSPRAMKAWGMSYERLAELNPRLIMLSTCLNGQTGPDANLAGYGTMGAALSGFGYLTGWPDRPPAAPFVAYSDYVSPKFMTAAILAALEHRRRTGRGQRIDCSQAECSIHLLTPAVLDHEVHGRVASPRGNANPHYAPSGVYPCAGEDRWVALAAPDDATWLALCRVADRGWDRDPRFASAEKRLANGELLDTLIAHWTAEREPHELEQVLQAAGVPVHRASTSPDLFGDPQLVAREHFVTLEHPVVGPVPVESSRLRLSRTPAGAAWIGPTLGQHNEYVLKEILGMGEDQITELVISEALE
ncbi:MAG: CoA transferase [Myxococcota bacterium]